jgi:hypothetical protein
MYFLVFNLNIFDQGRNDGSVPYWAVDDGSYRLDYWNSDTRLYITGTSAPGGPVSGSLFWRQGKESDFEE